MSHDPRVGGGVNSLRIKGRIPAGYCRVRRRRFSRIRSTPKTDLETVRNPDRLSPILSDLVVVGAGLAQNGAGHREITLRHRVPWQTLIQPSGYRHAWLVDTTIATVIGR